LEILQESRARGLEILPSRASADAELLKSIQARTLLPSARRDDGIVVAGPSGVHMSEERLERIETKVDGVETKVDGLETRFDGLETKFDDLGRQMRVLHEDLVGRIADLAPDYRPIRRER
jgi:hypothetical protein